MKITLKENSNSELAINGGNAIRCQPWPSLHPTGYKDKEYLLSVLKKDNWSNGIYVQRLEKRIAEFCDCKHALFLVNGTAALKVALLSIGIEKGDEIIVPGMTWHSVIFAVLDCGAIPITVDIDDCYGLSIDGIKKAITKKTKAIIATHLFCSQTDLPPVLNLAKSKGIYVIEDAAHVFGTIRSGKRLGTFGIAGFFSFNQKKNLTCGEGGCLVTNDDSLIEKARLLSEVLPDKRVSNNCTPQTLKCSEFLAAVLLAQLEAFPRRLKIQEARAEYLREKLNSIDGIEVLPRPRETELQTFYNFCFKVKNVKNIVWFREALSRELSLSMEAPYIPVNEAPVFSHIRERNLFKASKVLSIRHPNIIKAYNHEAVRFHHRALTANFHSMDEIVKAVKKVLLHSRQ